MDVAMPSGFLAVINIIVGGAAKGAIEWLERKYSDVPPILIGAGVALAAVFFAWAMSFIFAPGLTIDAIADKTLVGLGIGSLVVGGVVRPALKKDGGNVKNGGNGGNGGMLVSILLAVVLAGGFLVGTAEAGGPDVSGVTAGAVKLNPEAAAEFTLVAGPEVSLWTDTAKGRTFAVRTAYYYTNGPGYDDTQEGIAFGIFKSELPFWKAYLGVGSGMVSEFLSDAPDRCAGVVKFEYGMKVYKDLGFVVGSDYILGWGEVLPYFGIDLTPRL